MAGKASKKLGEQVSILLTEHGQKAFEIAKKAILQEKIIGAPVSEALRYFMEKSWHDVNHPALLSLACEAVDGNPNATIHVGAAMVLLAGAADIHDDIIDKSTTKGSIPTVLGKFGEDIALLAGDALLFRGSILLNEACKRFPEEQGQGILNSTKQAFFEIGNAEAKEVGCRGNFDLDPETYRSIIETKAAVAEANARIGAIIGGGSPGEIEALSKYGRALGILGTIRDNFIDIFELDELKNRVENECLPLPILYAFQDEEVKNRVINLIRKREIREEDTAKIVEIVMETKEIQSLRKEMQVLLEDSVRSLEFIKNKNVAEVLKQIVYATVEDL